jgi:myo-inositol-1(or 4)-monophosphatase
VTPPDAQLLAVAVEAAQAAGAALVHGLTAPKEIELKSERSSIVTVVDLAAQREVIRVITSRFPEHVVMGEEGDGGAASGDFVWLVDPLDGTSNYAHGIPFACTSIAVRDSAGVAAGAIYDPFRDELFTAVRGGGAWLGSMRLQVSDTEVLERSLACTGVQCDDPGAIDRFGCRMVALATHCRGVRCVGSPALCLAYVASGRIDAFVERDSTYAWDVAAGALMILEAGGRVEDAAGGPLNVGPGLADVLATNGRIHDDLALVLRGCAS